MRTKRRLTPWMIGVGIVTFLAGLLFGYDQGVISGALPLLKEDLDLSTFESEIITSWVTLGALFGALVAGGTADKIGRRWTARSACADGSSPRTSSRSRWGSSWRISRTTPSRAPTAGG